MFLEDLAHGVIDGVYRTATARSGELLFAEYLDQYGSFGAAALAFDGLEIHMIVDLAAQYSKGF